MNKQPKIVIVDNNDKVIGAEKRSTVLQNELIHRIVRVLLFNSEGKVFLQKRSPNKDVWPNRWDQSVGGHVDEGESYEDAVKREMKEELGIEDVNLKKITKFYTEGSINGKSKKRFNMLYEGLFDGNPKLQEEEISEGAWFEMDEVLKWMESNPDDFTPGCIKTFKKYREIVK